MYVVPVRPKFPFPPHCIATVNFQPKQALWTRGTHGCRGFPRTTRKAGHSWQHLHLSLSCDCEGIAAWFGFFFPTLSQKLTGQQFGEMENRGKGAFAHHALPRVPAWHPGFRSQRSSCCTSWDVATGFASARASPAPRVPSSTSAYGCSGVTLELQGGVVGGQGSVRRR